MWKKCEKMLSECGIGDKFLCLFVLENYDVMWTFLDPSLLVSLSPSLRHALYESVRLSSQLGKSQEKRCSVHILNVARNPLSRQSMKFFNRS